MFPAHFVDEQRPRLEAVPRDIQAADSGDGAGRAGQGMAPLVHAIKLCTSLILAEILSDFQRLQNWRVGRRGFRRPLISFDGARRKLTNPSRR